MSLPAAFLSNIHEQIATETEYIAFLAALAESAPTSIRLNPAKNSVDLPKIDLALASPVSWAAEGFYLPQRPLFTADPLLHAGAYYVQEAASMFLEQIWQKAIALTESEQSRPLAVLDLCAAPGGKSTHAASLLPADALLMCNEIIANRSQILQENLQKWGHGNIVITQNNPQQLAERLPQFFDIILVDAPCSGEGMFRKDPNAAAEWSPEAVEKCALRQREIIASAWAMLRPNGILIYSTCTYNAQENEENLAWWASQTALQSLAIDTEKIAGTGIEVIDYQNIIGYRFMPHRTKGEGFFAAFVQKLSDDNTELRLPQRFKSWTWQGRKAVATVSHLLREAAAWAWIQHKEDWRAFPQAWAHVVPYFYEQLRIVYAGVSVVEQVRDELKPLPTLALHSQYNRGIFAECELDLAQAQAFLRLDNFDLPTATPNGWLLITYQSRPLGWAKNMGNRFNNYYPKHWRIRMELPRENI
jgi:16S rRNA C967 or C1407 C5-methylase (RsmB/RsmF family)/NOL1/NOP2/fmu family ribosome biogenesis protein